MVRQTRSLSLSVFPFLSFLLSFTWSWLCFLWCTFEANENAPLGGRRCAFKWLGPKATSSAIEHQQNKATWTKTVEIEKRRKKRSMQKSVKNPPVESQWEAVCNLLELPPLKSSLLRYDNYAILLVSLLDSRVVEDKDLWAEWHVAFCLWRTTDEAFWEIPPGPKMDSPWSQLYQPLLGTTAFPLCSLYLSARHRWVSCSTAGQFCPSPFDPVQIKHQLLFDDSW